MPIAERGTAHHTLELHIGAKQSVGGFDPIVRSVFSEATQAYGVKRNSHASS
jgi:hypothetical protein